MPRRVGAVKKLSLASLADGWDDCYVVVTLMTKANAIEWGDLKPQEMTETEALEAETKIAKEHFVSGKIMILNDSLESELQDMQADDIEGVAGMADLIVMGILGVAPDPKGISTTTETLPTSQPTDETLNSISSTSQPSSTETSAK